MPRRVILGWIGIACWIAIASVREGFIQGASQESSRSALQFSPPRSVLDRYCVTCHSEKQKTAGLLLEKIDVENVPAGAEVWEKVIRKLRTGAMPPAGMPRPDNATYDSLATYLETTLDHAAEARPDPGRPALRRLNRAEYTNAVRDLLAMDVGAADIKSLLPADESAYGFNNIADVLSVSPLLLERYLSAAKKISRLAIGDPAVRPFFQDYTLSQSLLQDARMSEDLPFGSRGGFAIRHYFPLDGEYLLKVSLQSNKGGTIRGLAEPHQLDIRLDGSRIKLLTVGGKKKSAPQQEGDNFAAADPNSNSRSS